MASLVRLGFVPDWHANLGCCWFLTIRCRGGASRSLEFRQRLIDGSRDDEFTAFALPLAALTGGLATPPAVYFNATDADSGHITWFSNTQGGVAATYRQEPRPVRLSVGQAVLHSARFPIVTPAGAFQPPWAWPGIP